MPRPDQLDGPPQVLRELSELIVDRSARRTERLARLERMLAQLPEPSSLRGLIQYVRAATLYEARSPDSHEPAEEAIRLLPGYSAPLILAFNIHVYADRPEMAVDYVLRASEIDPAIVRQMPTYEVDNLRSRLSLRDDLRRIGLFAERMIALGWVGEDPALRSRLALDAINSRVEAGDFDGARALVSRLIAPGHLRRLLISNRYRALWNDVERWGGARQERQWPLYLRELRDRYRASGDQAAARHYAGALREANHLETVVREFQPLFERPLDRRRDYDLLWVAPQVADALARLGRWEDIDRLFERASAVWPLGLDGNALNIAANRAQYLLFADRFREAAEAMDRVIADAARRGGEVSAGALARMHLVRACALEEIGRGAEALDSAAAVLATQDPGLEVGLHLCFGRHDGARRTFIRALSAERTREDVLAFVQPTVSPPPQSDYGRRMEERRRVLREDPRLRAAVERYGRVLPFPLSAGAPPEEMRR